MRDSWLSVVGCVLDPARTRLHACLEERERFVDTRRALSQERARALAACEARIVAARAAVFAADDGVVSAAMTDLERRWRVLSRPDTEAAWMDLWSRIAPDAWLDRKLWRAGAPDAELEAAIALASDVEGVEVAEAAVRCLRAALAPWGAAIGPSLAWRRADEDFDGTIALFARPLEQAQGDVASRDGGKTILDWARGLEQEIYEAASKRLPERQTLARAIAHAAFVDGIWNASSLGGESPVAPLRRLWSAGYFLSGLDGRGAVLGIPSLGDPRHA